LEVLVPTSRLALALATIAFAPALAACAGAGAGQGGHAAGGHAHAHGAGPYAGLQTREIKALSPEQLADLRAGRGMSFALPAELNGYPGPAHVLELAAPLGLDDAQAVRTRELFARMQAEAREAGEALIRAESELDRLFATRTATPETLSAATARAGAAQARVRETHLRYHLAMMEVLRPEQVARYARLRGY
jgi:Spy/CpxP family protein refolding chaperone